MNEILQGLVQAFWLVISLDTELIAISLRSLYVTLTALLISTLVAFPLAALIVVTRFRFRRVVIAILNALMVFHQLL
jgi:tungstate transport system permease protein